MKISAIVSYKIVEANVLLTLLIVWLHVAANYAIPEAYTRLSTICVPCFWAISAFLYFISFDFSNSIESYKAKIISRTRSLLIPFLLFSLFGIVFNLLSYRIHPLPQHPFFGVTPKNFIWYLYTSKPNGPLWYLRSLYMFILVAPVLGYIIKQSKWSILLVIPLYFACKHVGYYYFPYWLVDIFIGAYIAIYYKALNNIKPLIMNILRWGGVFMAVLIIVFVKDAYVLRVLSPLCVLAIFSSIDVIPKSFTMILAPYSILIYCIHLPMSRIMSKVPGLFHITNPILSLVLATILTVLAIVGIGYVLRKFPRVWSVLTGGR